MFIRINIPVSLTTCGAISEGLRIRTIELNEQYLSTRAHFSCLCALESISSTSTHFSNMSDSSYDSDSEEESATFNHIHNNNSNADIKKKTDIVFHHNRAEKSAQNVATNNPGPERSFKSHPDYAGKIKEVGSYHSHEYAARKKDAERMLDSGFFDLPEARRYSYKASSSITNEGNLQNNYVNRHLLPTNFSQGNTIPKEQTKFQAPSFESHINSNARGSETKSIVGYRKLLEWASNQNSTILVFQMSMDVLALEKLLRQDSIQFDWMQLLITALKKVLGAQAQKGSLHYVMKYICESTFFELHLKSFLQELKRRRNSETKSLFINLIDIIEYLSGNLKAYSAKYNKALFFILDCGQKLNVIIDDSELFEKIKLLQSSSIETFNQSEHTVELIRPKNKRNKSVPMADDDTPPDNYDSMAIFPETEELYSPVEPFLRANKTKGAYRDLKHYLDIHSRLIKEDYLAPVRIGLKLYQEALANGEKAKEHDLRFYYEVKIQMKPDDERGITHLAIFDNSGMENIEWEFSKRLMFGSLLVFSKDEFNTTVFATVANRDLSELEKGIIEVVFENNLEVVFTSSENDRFVMAETTAYFESHHHVLEGLQEMKELPLERYILYCKKEVLPPDYLKKIPTYNLASVLTDENTIDEFNVQVLDEDQWPDAFSTKLNDSQLEALKLALTHEMAIIQGPPGTGKTYIGLKIMKILLENVTKESQGPVLVVCYTNHALDQFLEGILDFWEDGIVRVGGRSSSKLLEKYNLKELRSNPSLDRKIENNIKINIRICRRQLKHISKQIQSQWQQSIHLETTIVNVEDLESEMSVEHFNQLTDESRSVSANTSVMRTWLKASNANMDNFLFKASKQHLAKVIASDETCLEVRNDSVLTNRLSASKLLFKDRVKIYRFWLKEHRSKIAAATEECIANGESRALEQLLQDGEAANIDILPDDVLKQYISDIVYNAIKDCVEMENKKSIIIESANNFIKVWLLSNLRKTDQLLDAIEQLTEKKKESLPKQGINVDSEAKRRWVIDDNDSDSTNTETDVEDLEKETSIDDIDDIDDFRELARDFKLQENKDIQMKERAERLRIDLSEIQDNEDDDDWQSANNMSYSKVFHLFHKTVPYTKELVQTIDDIWKLPLHERYRLYKFWVQSKKKKLSKNLIILTKEFKNVLQRKKEANSLKDIAILQRARVIGMTTTGAARHRKVLQTVGCRIIVVEEAAEVLEAHIVTTLNSNCQHLILIGDHQQLRPSPTVHKLAVDYDLEISLFERLIKNHVPHVTLTEQHRMRPEISQFVRYIYPNLIDHYSVTGFEDVKGVNSNVFFLQHSFEESEVNDSTSKSNIHEAKFVVALCKYFLQHGYQGRQITILSAYSGQVTCIRNEMEPDKDTYSFVRVTSIDNYQGEENDILLLSLVRSNAENEVGFLKTNNRVCVALSRAKKGMFVIGNLPLLAQKSKLWKKILNLAQDERVTGVNMKLVCVNHPNHITYILNGEDFKAEVPEGGCNRSCNALLHCGHTCTRMCHASDRHHEESKCEQPCRKTCSKGHPCQKLCHEPCGDCEVIVKKNMPLCGHEDDVPCSKDVDEVLCSQTCGQRMECGHICRGHCGKCFSDAEHQACIEKVDKTWPACQHTSNVECRTDVSVDPCPEKCLLPLDCGHFCKGTCGGCLSGRVHRPCAEKCKMPLPCGHLCSGPCGGQCIPCEARCVVFCRHVGCNKNCGEMCDPCTENCLFLNCQHKQCNLRCMDECGETSCNKPCGKPVPKCKHKCYSLCGEVCVCYPCEKEKFFLIDSSGKKKPQYAVAHEKRERAKKFEVQSDTLLMKVPKCKDIFTLNQLDRWVEEYDQKSTSFIKCPNCPAALMGIARYENVNKQRMEKRENKKQALIKASLVSDQNIGILIRTKDLVNSFCNIDEGEFLSRKPDDIDANHALALTLQIRFSFVLMNIYKILQEFSENVKFAINKWKLIITSVNRIVTKQFYNEMTLELHRLLLLVQIQILWKYLQDIDIELPSELKTSCKTILKDKQKLTIEDKIAFQGIVDDLYDRFQELELDNHWLVRAKDLRKRSKDVTAILDQPMEKNDLQLNNKTEMYLSCQYDYSDSLCFNVTFIYVQQIECDIYM
ncbi:NFX1-type zinc finger-containing protein 1 [Bulinus truncatus]|nr:NFX1-type zinc finger-containing protein 1 [Bulinus truncatus]